MFMTPSVETWKLMNEFSASDIVYVVTSDANLVVIELIITCSHGDVAYLRHNYFTNIE